jgi:purine-binding chemotaxis protein CheW
MAIGDVQEVLRIVAVTPLPHAPGFVEGVINLRGVVTPVLDLRRRFGFVTPPADTATRIIITELGETTAGLIVDDVTAVATTDADGDGIDPSDALGVNLRQFVARVVKTEGELVMVIDPATLLNDAELDAVEAAAQVEQVEHPEDSDAGQA